MQGFDVQTPPFDRLTSEEAERLRRHVDIVYAPPKDVIVAKGDRSEYLYVIMKGKVETRIGGTLFAVLKQGDAFDARAVMHVGAAEDFVAAEETLCAVIPRDEIVRLVHRNESFAAFFYAEISRKLDELGSWQRRDDISWALRTRIREVRYAPAVFVAGDATLEAAAHHMLQADVDTVFVQAHQRIGIVTGMKITRATLIERQPIETPVREIARFDVISVDADQFLVDALLLMTRYAKRRLAIRLDGIYGGLLRDIDILGAFAGNAQLVPSRIDRATSLGDLCRIAEDIQVQAKQLHRQGVRVDAVAQITTDLNRRQYAKLFDLLAPASIRANGCLFLMGSEARGEQIYRTDQDNGLLLACEVPEADLSAFRAEFSAALLALGYPPCPGEIMVTNPVWSRTLGAFTAQLRAWSRVGDPNAAMNLAMFADAASVAGSAELLHRAKRVLTETVEGETRLLAQFANLINIAGDGANIGMFDTVFARIGLRRNELDLKRACIFPLVHGVRTLALETGVAATSTFERIQSLSEHGVIGADLGRNLASALRAFMDARLSHQLDAASRGTPTGSVVLDFDTMPILERDLLRDALRIVRQFRELVYQRYNLGQF